MFLFAFFRASSHSSLAPTVEIGVPHSRRRCLLKSPVPSLFTSATAVVVQVRFRCHGCCCCRWCSAASPRHAHCLAPVLLLFSDFTISISVLAALYWLCRVAAVLLRLCVGKNLLWAVEF
ncbi:hypothetical protein PIB30_100265 [Stylosanthes scabra]|uniref:Uncharacterized protein n=1 Tax=Stylosanthes scabra TaxID=79078 RepID=A0ABU6RYF5_9FABA|nr:hypothetical protein [Stylosanthes scabra]